MNFFNHNIFQKHNNSNHTKKYYNMHLYNTHQCEICDCVSFMLIIKSLVCILLFKSLKLNKLCPSVNQNVRINFVYCPFVKISGVSIIF